MKALLDDLLEYNRAKLGMGITMRPADVDAAIVLTEELNLLRAAYPGRRIEVELSGNARGVWDGMRLRQVLNNLVVNAINYGDPDTPVRIIVTGDEKRLIMEVVNDGPSIPTDALKSIFEPLRRHVSNDAVSGLGLGLFIARQIVEAHGGEISAESRNSNTVFSVRLPRT
jgi:signal transduction histidine kinase